MDGKPYLHIGEVRWFTNLPRQTPSKPLNLTCSYSPEKYPKYDKYDAINVDKTIEIPYDYDGLMGVPITFLDEYCPEQFEIVEGLNNHALIDKTNTETRLTSINGKPKYFRVVIRKKNK